MLLNHVLHIFKCHRIGHQISWNCHYNYGYKLLWGAGGQSLVLYKSKYSSLSPHSKPWTTSINGGPTGNELIDVHDFEWSLRSRVKGLKSECRVPFQLGTLPSLTAQFHPALLTATLWAWQQSRYPCSSQGGSLPHQLHTKTAYLLVLFLCSHSQHPLTTSRGGNPLVTLYCGSVYIPSIFPLIVMI